MADSVPVPPTTSDWVALRVELPAELADAVTCFLLDAGASGVVTEDRDVDVAPAPPERARLEAAVPADDAARVRGALGRYLASLAEIAPAAREAVVDATPLAPLDWAAVARAHHRPIAVGRRLLVAPPWDVPDVPDRHVLIVDPGMAFGTGQHPTTRACLEEIEATVDAGGVRVALDVGTGSGVLALALARLGVARVVALDADPAVLPIARATLARNGVRGVALVAGTAAAVRARFDLVVANLLADTIVAEAPALAATVAAGGRLVLAGILVAQAPRVRAAFPGARLVSQRVLEGWETFALAWSSGS